MSSTQESSPTPPEEKSTQFARALAWLRAEQNAADAPAYTSMLLHESAVVLESGGDLAEAAKNYRAALSFDRDFREPLERLVALAERQHQCDELGAFYQQLGASADIPEERTRACLERAFHLVEREGDTKTALQLLMEVVGESPDNAVAWLLVDLIADRAKDFEVREKALEARLNLADRAAYRGLLLLEWSALRELAGDVERALELLDMAIAEASPQTYPALLRKERIFVRDERWDNAAKVVEQRMRLVESAMHDPRAGEALGVSAHHRNQTTLGCLTVLLGQLHAQQGRLPEARICLSRALELLPGDQFARYLDWVHSERAADWERFGQIGEQLAQSSSGDGCAWISLRVAIAHWKNGDASKARAIVAQGLRAAPGSLALRALDVFLNLAKAEGLALASSLEQASECFDSDADKAHWLLAAAGVWALHARDVSGAKAAMTQAELLGLNPSLARHATRLFSIWLNDLDLREEVTNRIQRTASSVEERIDFALELIRLRLLRSREAEARDTAMELATADDAPVFATLIHSTLAEYLRRSSAKVPGIDATKPGLPSIVDWTQLATRASTPQWQRALELASAVDTLLTGDSKTASAKFATLGEDEPGDLLVAAARVSLALKEGDARTATSVLRQVAECTLDGELRTQLALQGVLLAVRYRQQEHLPQLLDLARTTHPEVTMALSRWLLRRISDEDAVLTERVVDASRTIGAKQRRSLEALGLSIARGEWASSSPQSEDDVAGSHPGLNVASALARIIGRTADSTPENLPSALAALNYFEGIEHADATDAPESTARRRLREAHDWAKSDPSLVAQLEWLFTCHNTNEFAEEAEARDYVARQLAAKDADALVASAQLLRFLLQLPALELLPSVSAAARLANLEQSLPGCDPRRRATALEETGELLGTASTAPLRACLGFNQLAFGDAAGSQQTFAELVNTHPRFIPGWLGLRVVAETTSDSALLAHACAALGDLLSEPSDAAAEWEHAALLLLDVLKDTARGKHALERAVALDVSRDVAFQRLFRMLRDAQQTQSLLELIGLRLPHAKSEDERLTLHWERARSLRSLGDREGALVALDAVSAIDPNHVGALALAGEINITLGRFDDAARFLAQLARHRDAPIKQRLMGGLAAADLFDKKLNRPTFAKDILLDLHREGHGTAALRERLSAIAVRVSAFPLALELLEILMEERTTSELRVDAARLAVVICRDHLHEPSRAARPVDQLLSEIPDDPEAIDLVLTGCFEKQTADRWLRDADFLLRERLNDQPTNLRDLDQLARVAKWFDDARTRQICLGALMCLGAGTPAMDEELSSLDQHVAHLPAVVIDPPTLLQIVAPGDEGPIASLFQNFAETYAEALGPTLAVLGVGKKQRVDPRAGLPLRNEIAAWAGAFGIVEFDLYLAEQVEGDAVSIPGERPSLVVANGLTTPLDPRGRQAIVRELLALRRGTSLLRHRTTTELLALVSASCQVGGHALSTPPYAMFEEFVRAVGSALPRRLRKTLSEHAAAIAAEANAEGIIKDYLAAAASSQDRAAALAAGDVSHVLAHLTGQRGRPPGTYELRDRTVRLLAFALSPVFLDLKDRLGLSVR